MNFKSSMALVTLMRSNLGRVGIFAIGRNDSSISVLLPKYISNSAVNMKNDEKSKEKIEGAKRAKTPIGKLDELPEGKHPYQEKEPLPPWPDNTNPNTGEIGGPRGPEPTRYGDWERKGRVTDF